MPLSDRTKSAAKWTGVAALFSMAALSPLSLSQADPDGEGGAAAPVTVTATVTAHVAPDQCDPVPDGKLPQRAVDYASDGSPITPDPSLHPEPPAADVVSDASALDRMDEKVSDDEGTAENAAEVQEASGPFDPYLCEATPETPTSTTSAAVPTTEQPRLEDVPGVSTELPDLPAGSDPETGPAVDFGTPKPESSPTPEAPATPGLSYPAIGAPR